MAKNFSDEEGIAFGLDVNRSRQLGPLSVELVPGDGTDEGGHIVDP